MTLVEIGVEISEQPRHHSPASPRHSAAAREVCLPVLRREHPGYAGTGAPHPQGLAQRIGAGLGGHREIPRMPCAVSAGLLGRFGGDLSRNTLAASIVRVGEAVQPIINLLRDHLLDADLVLGDETVIRAQRARASGPEQKLPVGADDRFGTADSAVRLCAGARRRPGQFAVCQDQRPARR